MSLFSEHWDAKKNYLPCDGHLRYWGPIYDAVHAQHHLQKLLHNIAWRHDEALMFGRHIITRRKYAWYADKPYRYHYSKIERQALHWNEHLLQLKEVVEKHTEAQYNSCLLNLYHNGEEGMSWHSDDEKNLRPGGSIASLSFGATRKFAMKHRLKKHRLAVELGPGDLLEMKGETQSHWLHALPKTKKVSKPRVNLTFRQMI